MSEVKLDNVIRGVTWMPDSFAADVTPVVLYDTALALMREAVDKAVPDGAAVRLTRVRQVRYADDDFATVVPRHRDPADAKKVIEQVVPEATLWVADWAVWDASGAPVTG